MNNFLKIFFTTLFIIHCSSDASSENILTYNLESDINEESNGSSNETTSDEVSNETTSGLSLELMFSYDNQTSSYSTLFENYSRSLIIHTPPNFDYLSESLPLLFVLHGYTSRASYIRQYSGFDQIADEERFIVVYVQGITDFYGNTGWNVDLIPSFSEVNDVSFFKALIEYFSSIYNIDRNKIYSSGMSLGGFMSYRLACELDEINSIGSVTGSMSGYYQCNPPKKTSVIQFHGINDATVPYDGNAWTNGVIEVHNFWKNHNQCQSQTENTLPDFNGDNEFTTHLISNNCDENKNVELYSLEGEGHTWWKKSWGHDINTSELIWQFFQDQQ